MLYILIMSMVIRNMIDRTGTAFFQRTKGLENMSEMWVFPEFVRELREVLVPVKPSYSVLIRSM